MARGFVVGNGTVVATGDLHGALHELYAPHFAPEHQLLRRPARIGLHAESEFHWLEDAFDASAARGEAAPIADVTLRGRELPFEIWIETFVDARRPILMRRIEVRNTGDRARELRLVLPYEFRATGAGRGAALRDAATGGVLHHGGRRALLLNALGPDGAGVPQVTVGSEQGPDCLLGVPIPLGAGESAMVTTWIAAARSIPEARALDADARRLGVRGLLTRTRGYWGLWSSAGAREETDLPEETRALQAHALVTLRLLQAPSGAFLSTLETPQGAAAPERRWCRLREAAIAADALGRAGYGAAARRYFEFTAMAAREAGELSAILDAEGTPAPLPEVALRAVDGIALHLWAAARHLERERDAELMAGVYEDSLAPAAERLAASVDPGIGLPVGADPWDGRWGAHAATAAAARGGLRAASRMAALFGETARARAWLAASDLIGRAVARVLYDPERGRFLRSLEIESGDRRLDPVLDASLLWLGLFDDLEPEDPRVQATGAAVRQGLWVRSGVAGLARNESDAAGPIATVASGERERGLGRPSVAPTLWLAQHRIRAARRARDLEEARILLLWASARAEGTGLIPERLDPVSGMADGIGPSLEATAAFVTTVLDYGERARLLARCDRCGEPAPARRARHVAARTALLPAVVADL